MRCNNCHIMYISLYKQEILTMQNWFNFEFIYKCGCKGHCQVRGKKDKDRIIDKYSKRLCPDCYYKSIQDSIDKGIYTELKGSEKQVRWANNIRFKLLAVPESGWEKAYKIGLYRWINRGNKYELTQEYIEEYLENSDKNCYVPGMIQDWICKQYMAKWFISNKFNYLPDNRYRIVMQYLNRN